MGRGGGSHKMSLLKHQWSGRWSQEMQGGGDRRIGCKSRGLARKHKDRGTTPLTTGPVLDRRYTRFRKGLRQLQKRAEASQICPVVCFGLAGHRLKFAGVGGTAHSDRNDDDPFLFLLCSALPRLLSYPRITIPQLSSTIRDHCDNKWCLTRVTTLDNELHGDAYVLQVHTYRKMSLLLCVLLGSIMQ